MTRKRPMAYLLAVIMICTAALAGIPVSYGAELPTTSQAYESVLEIQGETKDFYGPGETITLQLSISPQNGGSFGIRGYDTTIGIDTTKLEVVEVTAGALSDRTTLNLSYGSTTGNQQNIKWLFMDQEPAEQSAALVLGTITLQVKSNIISTTTAVTQTMEGISDNAGAWVETIKADPLSLTLKDQKKSYRFGLEVTKGAKRTYYPGDELTVRSYLTSGAVTFSVEGASTVLGMPASEIEVVTYQAIDGVNIKETTTGNQRKLSLIYLKPESNTQLVSSLELVTAVLRVKEDADPGTVAVAQSGELVYVSPTEGNAADVTSEDLSLTIGSAETECEFILTPADGTTTYYAGETVELNLVVKKDGNFYPRIANSEISFSNSIFEFVTASALSGTSIQENSGLVKWLYYNETAPEASGTLTLGSIQLKVKETAEGATVLNQEDANLAILDGGTLRDCRAAAPSLRLTIASGERPAGVTVSGYVGALPSALGGDATSGVRDITVTFAEGLSAMTDENGFFSIAAVPAGDYQVTFTGTGVVSRTETVRVGEVDIEISTTEKMVGVLRGDFTGDEDINLADLNEFMKSYNKKSTDQGFSSTGDFNYDNDISLEDLTAFMRHYNKGISYYTTWTY